jgi:hypothetical protein
MPPVTIVPVKEEWSLALSAPVAASLAICAGGLAACTLIVRRGVARETTLVPAWWWALAAALAWSTVEAAGAFAGTAAWRDSLRLAAVAISFCPVLAVLGAKRPQHAAWTFVVAALWAVVALPAAEALVLQRGQLAIGDVRGWFLWILVAIAPINYLPTRQWLAALLLAAGQVIAFSEFLPLVRRPLFEGQHLVALILASLSVAAARKPRSSATRKYDRLWLDFRDLFGLFWALRLQERVNAVASTNEWRFVLGWRGFVGRTNSESIAGIDETIKRTLRTSLKGLLRRFVSGRWIAERIAGDID